MTLFMYYGEECVHCHTMMPMLERVAKETGKKVKQLEVWHDSANRKKMEKINTMKCTGVPFFYNDKTGKSICGATSYNKLKAWAEGK